MYRESKCMSSIYNNSNHAIFLYFYFLFFWEIILFCKLTCMSKIVWSKLIWFSCLISVYICYRYSYILIFIKCLCMLLMNREFLRCNLFNEKLILFLCAELRYLVLHYIYFFRMFRWQHYTLDAVESANWWLLTILSSYHS